MTSSIQLQQVHKALGPARGSDVRYSKEAKRVSALFVKQEIQRGVSLKQISKQLRINPESLRHWVQANSASSDVRSHFLKVEVGEASSHEASTTDSTLYTCECVTGLRFTGLRLSDVITLIERFR